jgi:hypothetical protein
MTVPNPFVPLLSTLMDLLRSRASLQLEVLALRQQLSLVADRRPHSELQKDLQHFKGKLFDDIKEGAVNGWSFW